MLLVGVLIVILVGVVGYLYFEIGRTGSATVSSVQETANDQHNGATIPYIINWDIIGTTDNVELLITDPSGNQSGYLLENKTRIVGIPNAIYDFGGGILPPDGSGKGLPDHPEFSGQKLLSGIYIVQVIGKELGKYHVDSMLTVGSENISPGSLDGNITTIDQIDKYSISLPEGKIQKINNQSGSM